MRVLPKIVVVANDHTPEAIAFSCVAKHLRIPRVYVQHAAVSSIFPPLDFEAVVLMDMRSLKVYQKIGPLPTDTFIVPRRRFQPQKQQVLGRGEKISVCIYLGLPERTNLKNVAAAIRELGRNPGVSRVALSWHPRADEELIPEFPLFQQISGIWEVPHVALVGNSSVSFDLLEANIPQLKLFALDHIVDDYHGLVADGVLAEVGIGELFGDLVTRTKSAENLDDTLDERQALGSWLSRALAR